MTPDRFALPDDGLAAARLCLAQRLPAGDPVRLRAAAHRSGAFAAEIRHSAGVLLATADTDLWRGPAHQAFTEQLRAHAPSLTATADRYDEYAAALTGYAGALDEVAPPLGALRRQLQQGSDELAGRTGTRSGRRPAPARAGLQGALRPVGRRAGSLHAGSCSGPESAIRREICTAGRRSASHLATPRQPPSAPSSGRCLHPSLSNISACLGELNAGLSVLGLGLLFIYPPAGAACLAAATLLAVAQLAVDSARRAHGEQVSNASLGFELAAAIPLGGNALRSLRWLTMSSTWCPAAGLAAHEGVEGLIPLPNTSANPRRSYVTDSPPSPG